MKRISSVSMRKLISGLSEMLGGTANLRSRVGRIRFLRARDPGCIASFAGESFSFGQGLPRGAPTKNIANKLYCGFRFRRFGAPRVFSAFRKNNRGKKDFPCPVLPAIFFSSPFSRMPTRTHPLPFLPSGNEDPRIPHVEPSIPHIHQRSQSFKAFTRWKGWAILIENVDLEEKPNPSDAHCRTGNTG